VHGVLFTLDRTTRGEALRAAKRPAIVHILINGNHYGLVAYGGRSQALT
jgi:hypothetical protein